MGRNKETSAAVDGLLKFAAFGGILAAGLVAPNMAKALDKPTQKYFDHLDKRAREREMRRIVQLMKRQSLIKGDYEHGLTITKKGKQRAEKARLDSLQIPKPAKWDRKWRIIFYDIPEKHKKGRDSLTAKLKDVGFYQLQKSVWVHPFPCRDEVEAVCLSYGIDKYVSYIETSYIDKQKLLEKKFRDIL
jgi:DNA-binding transcriptional regulator PaaX